MSDGYDLERLRWTPSSGVTPEEGGPDGLSSKYPPQFRREAVELVRNRAGRWSMSPARSV